MHPVSFAVFQAKVSSKGLKLSCDLVSDVSVCAVYIGNHCSIEGQFSLFLLYQLLPLPLPQEVPGP